MNRERALKVVLVLLGLLFLAGLYPIVTSLRETKVSDGETMMLSIYVTLGAFLLIAVRNPSANRSLIAFTAWSSFAHSTVMAIMAFKNASERGELFGAVALLVVIGVVLLALAPAKASGERASAVGA
jgi:tryptophan-rich sensory protein